MLDAKKLSDPDTWQTDLDSLMVRVSDHHMADALKVVGPSYLQRFVTEKTITNNTAALGGNASLLALGDE